MKEIYVNILLRDGTLIHKARIAKNKVCNKGDIAFFCSTKEEIKGILESNNHLIWICTKYFQGNISCTSMIESYSILEE
ncbi:hypothetical protein BJV85_002820 [Clostridium acetobutylicum]|uniref:Uncharacterized protein n=1 Tax=Clostridium acetobutylicum (strain ATCC 824 / DSM 792 / JCM 1419 / IAM 19013 / LMG 5710 / NBRC 13948 / NRRL B-527 / VKM B-1787 / 2291 / W) TaxID=272562 RepID=Q97JU6_CLOAB|nr:MULTISPECIES: hypothetical protein [Clostridium]AAK79149.1 Hypothetical protein CA_C1177 [Clostridium acetobutylicum ATCC 824]ADZ20227.1 Conserved hypothetical protein [Clostridium acetobutylicum EA 2018]AEI31684.1 hypothetical protein SMB_G1197 [Clostridium acetobutylicum DSM 1731]AWV81598.1 hypothetical protein DK921_16165 [Clostridium acetobutylicum]MBC2393239.1 hypothetical protein [Clostridium acetobutylicum]